MYSSSKTQRLWRGNGHLPPILGEEERGREKKGDDMLSLQHQNFLCLGAGYTAKMHTASGGAIHIKIHEKQTNHKTSPRVYNL